MDLIKSIDLIKYPIVSDKATKLLKKNQYTFAVAASLDKTSIKIAIEHLFNVKVLHINTHIPPTKHRRRGKFTGNRAKYKKAILRLAPGNSINLSFEST